MVFYDLSVHKGADLRRSVRLKQGGVYVDLTGWTAKSQVRVNPDGGELVCEIGTSIDTVDNKIVLAISDEVTAGINTGVYFWDLRITSDEDITEYYLGGKFTVLPSVTE